MFFAHVTVKYMEKNLDIAKPLYSEHIFPVPWPLVKSSLHSRTVAGAAYQGGKVNSGLSGKISTDLPNYQFLSS